MKYLTAILYWTFPKMRKSQGRWKYTLMTLKKSNLSGIILSCRQRGKAILLKKMLWSLNQFSLHFAIIHQIRLKQKSPRINWKSFPFFFSFFPFARYGAHWSVLLYYPESIKQWRRICGCAFCSFLSRLHLLYSVYT